MAGPVHIGKGHVPPLFELGDRGVSWEQEGQRLVIRRRPNLLSVALPLMATVATIAMSVGAWLDGAVLVSVLFAVFTLIPAAVVWMRGVSRFTIELGPDGLHWAQTGPRRFEGRWPISHMGGVRLFVGARPARWGSPRTYEVLLRIGEGWCPLAFGHSKRRAERLADAVALSRAWPVSVHHEETDGTSDGPPMPRGAARDGPAPSATRPLGSGVDRRSRSDAASQVSRP